MIDFLKYKKIYLVISCLFLIPGVISLIINGLKLSIDFTGGTLAEYKFERQTNIEDIQQSLSDTDTNPINIQGQDDTYILKFGPLDSGKAIQIKKELAQISGNEPQELRFETLGPSIGKELLQKTLFGLLLATILILLYIAYAFKDLKFGICATLATLHDSVIILGLFSIFGVIWHVEIDALFVTALLTILSFSVHDTIVVFDRIRENSKISKAPTSPTIINQALNETIVRSLNNSLTIIFMLSALLIFGGETIRWFVVALLVGTISGTYSSPFVATPLLLLWDRLFKK